MSLPLVLSTDGHGLGFVKGAGNCWFLSLDVHCGHLGEVPSLPPTALWAPYQPGQSLALHVRVFGIQNHMVFAWDLAVFIYVFK